VLTGEKTEGKGKGDCTEIGRQGNFKNEEEKKKREGGGEQLKMPLSRGAYRLARKSGRKNGT